MEVISGQQEILEKFFRTAGINTDGTKVRILISKIVTLFKAESLNASMLMSDSFSSLDDLGDEIIDLHQRLKRTEAGRGVALMAQFSLTDSNELLKVEIESIQNKAKKERYKYSKQIEALSRKVKLLQRGALKSNYTYNKIKDKLNLFKGVFKSLAAIQKVCSCLPAKSQKTQHMQEIMAILKSTLPAKKRKKK